MTRNGGNIVVSFEIFPSLIIERAKIKIQVLILYIFDMNVQAEVDQGGTGVGVQRAGQEGMLPLSSTAT